MRRATLGSLVGVGVIVMVAIATAQQRGEFPQRGAPASAIPTATAGSELVVVSSSLGEKNQVLTVVDPRQRVVCVYHIDLATGKIALKGVRNIQWDLQINDLNNEKPLPQEVQSLLNQK